MSSKPTNPPRPNPSRKSEVPAHSDIRFSHTIPPLPATPPREPTEEELLVDLSETQTFLRLSNLTQLPPSAVSGESYQLAVIHYGVIDSRTSRKGYLLILTDPQDPNLILAQHRAEDLPTFLEMVKQHVKPE